MILILGLFGLVLAAPDALFGGGCTVVNDNLIITAAFYKQADVPVLSRKSYFIDLASRLTLDANSQLGWKELGNERKIPGGFFREGKAHIMYTMGSNTVEPSKLKRRSTDDNPLGNAMMMEVKKSDGSMSAVMDSNNGPVMVNATGYLHALIEGLKIAVIYKNTYHLLRNPEHRENTLSTISIVTGDSKYNNITLMGTPPPYMSGYSAALRLNTVYIATDNKIHTLDLNTYEWKEHTVKGFKAAQSGCLITHMDTLIHAFGKEGDKYLNRTQFIDMKTWMLKGSLNFDESGGHKSGTSTSVISAEQKGLSILNIVLIVCVSLMALAVLTVCTIHCIQKLRKLPELTAPEYYTEAVWADPGSAASLSCQIDLSLSNGGEISDDLTPGSSPFSTDDHLYSPYQSMK
ncbi:hypothetical protein DSO57_1013679 [Entomophthora muscae]|uniref:Uncharacterized protein n=1 Tax=Entomophthora muscae TaxID=34485 RepID=A0ACC2SV12_9FUNG|nr:hypothetical protein DSO57_1013679 [Entomophthora muscae]